MIKRAYYSDSIENFLKSTYSRVPDDAVIVVELVKQHIEEMEVRI